ncbi:hypothetical protein YC2023_026252 [Brassica napus]
MPSARPPLNHLLLKTPQGPRNRTFIIRQVKTLANTPGNGLIYDDHRTPRYEATNTTDLRKI